MAMWLVLGVTMLNEMIEKDSCGLVSVVNGRSIKEQKAWGTTGVSAGAGMRGSVTEEDTHAVATERPY